MAGGYPSRLVILRHGEKLPQGAPEQLCPVGVLRAQALAEYYLGQGARNAGDIFGEGKEPDVFFTITPHTRQTAAPSVASWNGHKQYIPFSSDDLDGETIRAAEIVKSAYEGKTVVIVWEHHHIADKHDKHNTFWSQLRLGNIAQQPVPAKWEGVNYDYFWVIDYTAARPTFTPVLQKFDDPKYSGVPDNPWAVAVDAAKFPYFYRDCDHKKQADLAPVP